MKKLGYIHHPYLPDGRSNFNSMIDNLKKPTLYVKEGSLQAGLTDSASIDASYQQAQGLVIPTALQNKPGTVHQMPRTD